MEPILDWRTKGLPPRAEGLSPAQIGRLGLRLLDGDLLMPAAVLRERALAANIAGMQAFADREGALLCPHGKTSMSRELFAMQLKAGAWGLTAATAHHVRVYRRLGVRRILLGNEPAGRGDLTLLADELAGDANLDLYCLVDSPEGAALLAGVGRRAGRPVQVLIETGPEGGRAGVRSAGAAAALAAAVAAEPALALRGVETFEGVRQTAPDGRGRAGGTIELAVGAAERIARDGLFAEGPVLLSAGGSAFLDLVAAALPARLGDRPVRRVIRPGCYVTHDHGLYAGLVGDSADLPRLEPALEVWGAVLSVPEPGLAIVGVGKRDVSHDAGPPLPIAVHRIGRDSEPQAGHALAVESLWDQHLSLADREGRLAVGDLVGFGISHPCATFDRWTALMTVDEDYRVTGAVTTLF